MEEGRLKFYCALIGKILLGPIVLGMVVHHLINGVIMGLSRRDSTLIELSSDPAAFYVFAGLWLVLAAFTMAISVKALMFYFKNRR